MNWPLIPRQSLGEASPWGGHDWIGGIVGMMGLGHYNGYTTTMDHLSVKIVYMLQFLFLCKVVSDIIKHGMVTASDMRTNYV